MYRNGVDVTIELSRFMMSKSPIPALLQEIKQSLHGLKLLNKFERHTFYVWI